MACVTLYGMGRGHRDLIYSRKPIRYGGQPYAKSVKMNGLAVSNTNLMLGTQYLMLGTQHQILGT